MGECLNWIWWVGELLLWCFFYVYFFVVCGMMLGVCVVVLDVENKVFLVRYSYVSGWYLFGGGVDFGEIFEEVLWCELKEEGDIDLMGEVVFYGVFFNSYVFCCDYVVVYVVWQFRQDWFLVLNYEISECGFFVMGVLLEGIMWGMWLWFVEVFDGIFLIVMWC